MGNNGDQRLEFYLKKLQKIVNFCLLFDGKFINEIWRETNSNYTTLHGIALSQDGQYVYVSGRGDGYIYKFDTVSGQEVNSAQLVSTGMNRTGGIAITKQQ